MFIYYNIKNNNNVFDSSIFLTVKYSLTPFFPNKIKFITYYSFKTKGSFSSHF